MHSLASKLTLAFLLVGITGTLLVALAVTRSTQREFDRFLQNRYETDLVEELGRFYAQTNSWENITAIVARGRRRSQIEMLPVTVIDTTGKVIYSQRGTPEISPQQREDAAPITVNGAVVGYAILDTTNLPWVAPGPSPEALFLGRVRGATILGVASAIGVALLLGFLLARTLTRPLRELTSATRSLTQGHLGAQVSVQSQDELGELALSFNQMSADLARSAQQRRQMTADIAHDLRTPLSVILGYAEALSDGKIKGDPDIYAVIHGEAQHLQRLIEDLRLLSLADAGELTLNRQSVSPHTLLQRAFAAHIISAEERGVALTLAPAAELPAVFVDPERIAQVLNNLVSNALRHTPAGGQIRLWAKATANAVILHVEDTGEGITPEHLPHIFERFYRADAARTQSESGLGLAIARSLVQAHGGTISATSTPGRLTTFTVTLPVS